MYESNLLEAFASYRVKPTRRGRSAMTPDSTLVVSCWYAGFKKTDVETLRYEEDLSGQAGEIASALRAHLAEAKTNDCDVRVIVAVGVTGSQSVDQGAAARTRYYARRDLVGRVTSFDGERFAIEFRRTQNSAQEELPTGMSLIRRPA
jgi:hypothetical protein